MRVKVPKSIMVGGHNYSIVFLDALEDEGLAGAHNPRKTTIEINPNRLKHQWDANLLHELTHAISHVYNGNRLSEDDIKPLSEGLYQVFRELDIEFDWGGIA